MHTVEQAHRACGQAPLTLEPGLPSPFSACLCSSFHSYYIQRIQEDCMDR